MPDREEKKQTLHVMPGVPGGHDGLPRSGKASRPHRHSRKRATSTEEYVQGVLDGDRTLLGRAITLIESNAPHHFQQAQELLRELLPHAGNALRVGISGVPGAGKSTFIEALGSELTGRGQRVAVTAVDPTSSLTGGSIMGDKTRMERLAGDPNAFIRPCPSGGALGGVARKTRETIVLFEAAGYDVVFVETVGVGQSEIAVRSMVDFFLLLLIAGAGDELQGMKKGVVEIADAIVINKADGDNVAAANRAKAEYEQALHYLAVPDGEWSAKVQTASALTGEGIGKAWDLILEFHQATRTSGQFKGRRRDQARKWMHELVRQHLMDLFRNHEGVRGILPELEEKVMAGELPASTAAIRLLKAFGIEEDFPGTALGKRLEERE